MNINKYGSRNKSSKYLISKTQFYNSYCDKEINDHDTLIACKLALMKQRIEEKYQQSITNQIYQFPCDTEPPLDNQQSRYSEKATIYNMRKSNTVHKQAKPAYFRKAHTRNISQTAYHKSNTSDGNSCSKDTSKVNLKYMSNIKPTKHTIKLVKVKNMKCIKNVIYFPIFNLRHHKSKSFYISKH